MKKDIIGSYNEIKFILNKEDYKGFKLGNILSDSIWKQLSISKYKLIPRILYNIAFCNIEIINENLTGKKNIVIFVNDMKKIRPDHRTIFNNAKSFILDNDYFEIKKTKKFNFKFIENVFILFKNLKYFYMVKGIVNKIYLSSMLCIVEQVLGLLKNRINTKKNLLVFQDIDVISNVLVQYVQNNGGKAVTLQHGQFIYRQQPYSDYLNIVNFTSNYILVWNEFTKKQFLEAGFNNEKIILTGSTKYLRNEETNQDLEMSEDLQKKEVFGIVLDTPVYEYSLEYNNTLLEIADKISKKLNMKYVVKLHPFDTKENYEKYLQNENFKEFIDITLSMKDYADKVDFSLAHTTGAAVDLMIMNKLVFLYKTEIPYPLIIDKVYEFKNEEELYKNIKNIFEDYDEYYRNYKIMVKKYYYIENSYNLHKEFFDREFNH